MANNNSDRHKKTFLKPIGRRLNSLGTNTIRLSTEAILRSDHNSSTTMNGELVESIYDDDNLAPVMPAIDALQQLMDEENRLKNSKEKRKAKTMNKNNTGKDDKHEINYSQLPVPIASSSKQPTATSSKETDNNIKFTKHNSVVSHDEDSKKRRDSHEDTNSNVNKQNSNLSHNQTINDDDDDSFLVRNNNPLIDLGNPHFYQKKQEEYEFIPKSVILDVYSNDPEVKRFLKQLPKIGTEFGFNEQDYKCYSCRRPIGMLYGQPRLCHFDGHHYCSECHLNEKSHIPARILCNWDFNKYPISKRNQHFLTLISNEPMFELNTMAPLLYKTCPELREIEELRHQAFSIRSYCFTCVQDTISFELTKLVWPREHLIKQIDQYSLEDLIQIKSGALKSVLKTVITFGRQHVLTCMLCCQKGFICELCKSSQIIYPFDTESIYRCNNCQSIYHKNCFKSRPNCDECPRCIRLLARRSGGVSS